LDKLGQTFFIQHNKIFLNFLELFHVCQVYVVHVSPKTQFCSLSDTVTLFEFKKMEKTQIKKWSNYEFSI